MKIKLLSDLHLESRTGYYYKEQPWSKYNGEDVLVLAGDIAVGADNVLQAINYFYMMGFSKIIYCPGNHEYYRYSRDEHEVLKRATKCLSGVYFLDADDIVHIDDVSFFGGTLWTNFGNDPIAESAARVGINDFKLIKGWTTQHCIEQYERHSQYIKWAYENTPGKKCIVTHFMPAKATIAGRYKDAGSTLNKYFASNLDDWVSTLENTTWLFGHTHDAMDFYLGNTRLVSNPLGYPREFVPDFAGFNPDKVIEL